MSLSRIFVSFTFVYFCLNDFTNLSTDHRIMALISVWLFSVSKLPFGYIKYNLFLPYMEEWLVGLWQKWNNPNNTKTTEIMLQRISMWLSAGVY